MADDTIDIVEPFDFHPCNSPRGMLYYDLKDLENDQKTALNEFKINLVREDEKYLANHPQIRALIAMITRQVLRYRPRTDLLQFIGHYFTKSEIDLAEEMQEYMHNREPHKYEGDSAVGLNQQYIKEEYMSVASVEEEEEEEVDLTKVPRQMLDEIVEMALARLGTKAQETGVWKSDEVDEKSVVRGIISEILQRATTPGRSHILNYLYATTPGGEFEEMVDDQDSATTFLQFDQPKDSTTGSAEAAEAAAEPAEAAAEPAEAAAEPAEAAAEPAETAPEFAVEAAPEPTAEAAAEPSEAAAEPSEETAPAPEEAAPPATE